MTATATTYEIHPLALLVPGMTEEEYAELREDVAEHGLRVPILLFEGKVLDGRHRYRACSDTGVWPTFTEYTGEEPASEVLSLNLHRRNLTESQRAMLAVEFLPALEEEAAQRKAIALADRRDPVSGQSAPLGALRVGTQRAADDAADKTGASGRSVQKAKRVKAADPDLALRVLNGETTVSAAEREVVTREKVANGSEAPKPEKGKRLPQAIVRVAERLESTLLALDEIAIQKSCTGLTTQERQDAAVIFSKAATKFRSLANLLGKDQA